MVYAERDEVRSKIGKLLIDNPENTAVTATLATLKQCRGSLPAFFSAGLISTGGAIVCKWMKTLSKDYAKGPWNFYP